MRSAPLLGALALLLAGCVTAEVTETVEVRPASSTTRAAPTTTTSTPSPSTLSNGVVTTRTTGSSAATLADPEFVGVWPYRTTGGVLAAAVDGLDVTEVELIARFMEEVIGWTQAELTEVYDGTDSMGFDYASPRGEFSVRTRIVGWSPAGDAVVAVSHASSLEGFEPWGPAVDVGEGEDGWSVIVNAAPISAIEDLPNVTGPFAAVSYGDWESDLVEIGPAGAEISLPTEPTVPGVLSIWYLHTDGAIAGFSIQTLPPDSFTAG